MRRQMTIIIGGAVSIGMVVAALWCWRSALRLSATASRPDIELWAIRSAAIALAAIAQAVLLTFVVRRLYRPDWTADLLRICAGLAGGVALVSAAALALAGR